MKKNFLLTKFPVPNNEAETPCTFDVIYLMCDGKIIATFQDIDETYDFGYFLNELVVKPIVDYSFESTLNSSLRGPRRSEYCQRAHDLEQKLGSVGARKEIARQLRIYADHLDRETDSDPRVFGCELLAGDKPCSKDFIETLSVTLSYPWPG